MIDIGTKGFIGGTNEQASPYSGGGAQNAAKALGGIGRALMQAGEAGFEIAAQLQTAKNAKVERERMNELELAFAQHEAENMGIRDPEERLNRFNQFVDEQKPKVFSGDYMPPEVRRNLETGWGSMVTQKRARALSQAGQLMVEQTRTAYGVAIDRAKTYEESLAIGRDMKDKGIISGAEFDQFAMSQEDRFKKEEIQTLVRTDPYEAKHRLDSGDYDSLDPGDLLKVEGIINSGIRMHTANAIDAAHDGMANGSITKAAQIDEMFPTIPDREKESLKLDLAQRASALSKAQRESPEYQQEAIGRITRMLDGVYTLEGEEFNADYSKASYELSLLPDSPSKRWLTEKLSAAKEGRDAQIKDHYDRGRKSLDELRKDPRVFKSVEAEPTKQEMSIQKAVSDGILRDRAKLGKLFLGYEDAQKKIMDAQVDEDGNQIEEALSDPKVAELFREEFGKLPPGVQQAGLERMSPIDRAVIEGIRDRKGFSSSVSYVSPEAEDAIISAKLEDDKKFGKIQMEFEGWLKDNAGAKPEAVSQALRET